MLACSLIDSSHQSMLASSDLTSPIRVTSTTPPDFISSPAMWYYNCGEIIQCASFATWSTVKMLISSHRSMYLHLSISHQQEGRKEQRKERRNERNKRNKPSRDLDLPHSALLVSTQLLASPRTSSGEWPGSTTIIDIIRKRGRLTTFVDTNITVFSVT